MFIAKPTGMFTRHDILGHNHKKKSEGFGFQGLTQNFGIFYAFQGFITGSDSFLVFDPGKPLNTLMSIHFLEEEEEAERG